MRLGLEKEMEKINYRDIEAHGVGERNKKNQLLGAIEVAIEFVIEMGASGSEGKK